VAFNLNPPDKNAAPPQPSDSNASVEPHEEEQLLWDGILFDRSDWLEHALSLGVSPDTEFEIGITAVFVAAYLNRTRCVQLLADYGASYYYRHQWDRGPASVIELDFVDYGEPMECAIEHRNYALVRALRVMPWRLEGDNRYTEKCDRCWDYALSLAEQGDAVLLDEMILADLLSGDTGEDRLLHVWCKDYVPNLRQIMEPFFRRIKRENCDPPKVRLLPQTLLLNKHQAGLKLPPFIRVALHLDYEVHDLPNDSGDVAMLNWGRPPFLPRCCNLYSYFERFTLSETVLVERIYIEDLEYCWKQTDVTLFITHTPTELRHFTMSRSYAKIVKRFVESLLNKDIQAIEEVLRGGVQLDFPLRGYDNLLSLAKHILNDHPIVGVIEGAAYGSRR
jgi:hypothetical protein